jgi:hypothetical protein
LLPQQEVAESVADDFGCGAMFHMSFVQHAGVTNAYGAAVLAVRIFEALQRFGVKFLASYPEDGERIHNLREAAVRRCPSLQFFHEISWIGVSYEESMDDVEDAVLGAAPSGAPSSEHLLVTFIAELLEVAQGRSTIDALGEHLHLAGRRVGHDAITSAVRSLDEYYLGSPRGRPFLSPEIREQMGAALRTLHGQIGPDTA